MTILLFLLTTLIFLPLSAQAKDKDAEVIQKADIIFQTDTKESPKVKKPSTQQVTTQQTTSQPAPTSPASRDNVQKAKTPSTQESTSKSTQPEKDSNKDTRGTTDTKKPTPVPSPLASKPEDPSSSEAKQATPTNSIAEVKKIRNEVTSVSNTPIIPVSATSNQTSLQEILAQAYESLQKDKKYEARNLYSQALFMESSEERRRLIRKHLDELNSALLFSSSPNPDFLVYDVQSGDNLTKIAKRYNTTPELLMRLNRKTSTLLRIGEPLRILKGRVSLLIDKSDFTLTLLLEGHYLKQYPVGIGKEDKTPEGTFIIANKMKDPTWYSPLDGKVYPYGHPENILGTRWIGFENQPGLTGYGIHGTTEPESIGTESSNGCIRMANQNVEELYDYVTVGAEVFIQR